MSKYCSVSSKVLSHVGLCSIWFPSLELLCVDESEPRSSSVSMRPPSFISRRFPPTVSQSLVHEHQWILNVPYILRDHNYWGLDHPSLACGALGESSRHAHFLIVLGACPSFGGFKVIEVYLLFSHLRSESGLSCVWSPFTLESCV